MEENLNNENGSNNQDKKKFKKGFFKKVWYSIFKLEKYGEMAAEGLFRAISYLLKLTIIISLLITIGTVIQANELKNKGIKFLNEQVGEFTYKDGILQLEKDTPIRAPSSSFGEIIIDVNDKSEEEVNQYLNSLEENRGIILLKDKVLLKGISTQGTVSYNYKELLDELDITEANKQQTIDYFSFENLWTTYLFIAGIIFIVTLINTFLPFLFDVVLLSIFGFIATLVAKIRMRFVAIFNLAVYSMTLSVILYALYIFVNLITQFSITYFEVMYFSVAAIYIIAAIFMIKSDFLSREVQVSKTVQIKKQIEEKENDENQEEQEKDKDKNKDTGNPKEENKKGDKKGKEDKEDGGDEPEGSHA